MLTRRLGELVPRVHLARECSNHGLELLVSQERVCQGLPSIVVSPRLTVMQEGSPLDARWDEDGHKHRDRAGSHSRCLYVRKPCWDSSPEHGKRLMRHHSAHQSERSTRTPAGAGASGAISPRANSPIT